jgi:hypothetical protein
MSETDVIAQKMQSRRVVFDGDASNHDPYFETHPNAPLDMCLQLDA